MSKTTSPAARGDSSSTSLSLDDSENAALASLALDKVDEIKITGKNNDSTLSGKRAIINVSRVTTETGAVNESANAPLFVGLNGFGYHIPRGVNVSVPIEVLDILDNAIQKVYPTKDGIVVGEHDVPRHAYRVSRVEA